MMKLKNIFLILITATVIGFTMTGCEKNEKNEEDNILKPIAEHLIGRWSLDAGYMLGENGEWTPLNNKHGFIKHLRPDGTMSYIEIINSIGRGTYLHTKTWKVNEADKTYMESDDVFPILMLTEDRLVIGSEIEDGITGEIFQTKIEYCRIDENERLFVEKMVGKWVHFKSYEETDGEWKETDFAVPDYGYFEFRNNGSAELYSRTGNHEFHQDGFIWHGVSDASVTDRGEVRIFDRETYWEDMEFVVIDGNTVEHYYEENHDPVTGETRKGKFKDVLVREQE